MHSTGIRLQQNAKKLPPKKSTHAQCLKIALKVAFKIASEASFVFTLNVQKFIKNAKVCTFWPVFENLKLAVKQCYQTCQFQYYKKMPKFKNVKCDILDDFQTL